MRSSVQRFKDTGFRTLILTKLDETSRYGKILDAVWGAERPVSFVTYGQGVPDDIELAASNRLARMVLYGEWSPRQIRMIALSDLVAAGFWDDWLRRKSKRCFGADNWGRPTM